MNRTSLVPRIVGAFLVAAAIVGFFVLRSRAAPRADLFGVRLGFTAADTRERFKTPGPGGWTVTSGDEPTLTWHAADPASAIRDAKFEFHDGILVAERFDLAKDAPEAKGPPLELSAASVIARDVRPEGVEMRVISRDCPTHADEVQRILRSGGAENR